MWTVKFGSIIFFRIPEYPVTLNVMQNVIRFYVTYKNYKFSYFVEEFSACSFIYLSLYT
jgi:hypothetical protein